MVILGVYPRVAIHRIASLGGAGARQKFCDYGAVPCARVEEEILCGLMLGDKLIADLPKYYNLPAKLFGAQRRSPQGLEEGSE